MTRSEETQVSPEHASEAETDHVSARLAAGRIPPGIGLDRGALLD
jgi:hypothetical protein